MGQLIFSQKFQHFGKSNAVKGTKLIVFSFFQLIANI